MEVSAILLCHLSLSPGTCPCPQVTLLAPRCLQPGAGRWQRSWGCAESNKLLGKKTFKKPPPAPVPPHRPARCPRSLSPLLPAACPLCPLSVLSPSPLSEPRSAGGSGQGADKLLQLLYHRVATCSLARRASFWGVPPASRVLQGAENPAGGCGAARVPPCPTRSIAPKDPCPGDGCSCHPWKGLPGWLAGCPGYY